MAKGAKKRPVYKFNPKADSDTNQRNYDRAHPERRAKLKGPPTYDTKGQAAAYKKEMAAARKGKK